MKYLSEFPSGEDQAVRAQKEALLELGLEVMLWDPLVNARSGSATTAVRAGWSQISGLGESPAQLIASWKPDLILVHNLFPFGSHSWARNVAAPVVVFQHNYRRWCAAGTLTLKGRPCLACAEGAFAGAIRNRCYRNSSLGSAVVGFGNWRLMQQGSVYEFAEKVVALSDRSVTNLVRLGVNEEKIYKLPNFSRLENLSPHSRPRKRAWLFVGRIDADKGLLSLVDEWPDSYELTVVGDGPERAQAERASLGKPISFIGNVESPSVLAEIYSQHQGLVFPSKVQENSPLAFLEALSMGRPVVSTLDNVVGDELLGSNFGCSVEALSKIESALELFEGNVIARAAAYERYRREYSQATWKMKFSVLVDGLI